jgi:GGDEF domain-containing protein
VVDPATGLQLRTDAEQLIASRIVEGKDALVALFLVDRLSSLNSRFGRKVGDEVLLMVAQHLGQQLPEKSPPFRWSGPAFLAVLGLSGGSQSTERLVRQIAAARLEKNTEALGRSVLLPVSCSVVVLKIGAGDSAEIVFHTLDKHVASHSGDPN